jgi:hypothetical protein
MQDLLRLRQIKLGKYKPDPQPALKDKLVILPHHGEFGFFIFHHLRYCYQLTQPHIICCKRGEELFYPKASGFYYDWECPIAYDERSGDGNRHVGRLRRADRELTTKLTALYPNHSIIRPTYKNCWRTMNIKFPIVAEPYFPKYELVVATRKRQWAADRNVNWDKVIERYRGRIAIAGAQDSSVDYGLPSAWQHPNGCSAGTIDLLNNCRWFLGSDSGVSHLAAFLNVPMVIIKNGCMTGMFRCSSSPVHIVDTMDQLLDTVWKLTN